MQTTTIHDILTITPIKDTFHQGEVVVFELIIPDSVLFHDRMVSLFSETGDTQPQLVTDNRLFINNKLDFYMDFRDRRTIGFILNICLPRKNIFLE